MLKRLTMLAVLAILSACCPNQCPAQDQPKSQTSPESPVTIVDNSIRQDQTDRASKKSPEPHTGVEWTQLTAVLIGLITLIGVFKQANETKKAAIAAQQNAEAARNNTLAAIRAQRAWLVIKVVVEDDSKIIFRAVNEGQTPAEVLSINGRPQLVSPRDKFKIDWSALDESLISTPPTLLPPKADCLAYWLDLDMAEKTHTKVFYGKIRYFDVLEPSPKTVHETTWRYWLPIGGRLPIPDPFDPGDNSWT